MVDRHWSAARRIAKNFQQMGIRVRAVSGKVTPYGVTCVLALTQPNGAQITNALRMAPVLEMRYRVGGVRVWSRDGLIHVQIPLPTTPGSLTVDHIPAKAGQVALGIGLDGKGVYSTWELNPHLMLLGPTGCGKTTLTRAILQQLPGHQVAIAAFKAKDWRDVQGATVLKSIEEIEAFGQWVVKELRRRAPLGEDLPLCWVVDDAFNLLSACSLPLDEIASLGRGLDTHLIVASQRAGDAVGGAMAAGNIPGRIVFRTASAADAAHLTGRRNSGAERLQRFHALFVTPDDVTQFKAAMPGGAVTSSPVTGWDSVLAGSVTGSDGTGYAVTPEAEPVTDVVTRIRKLNDDGYSKNEISHRVFGGKNGRYMEIINNALQLVS